CNALRLCAVSLVFFLFFFFQAEDGIRDFHVTGVQTCALPIYQSALQGSAKGSGYSRNGGRKIQTIRPGSAMVRFTKGSSSHPIEIGRASCRERAWNREGGARLKHKPSSHGENNYAAKATVLQQ